METYSITNESSNWKINQFLTLAIDQFLHRYTNETTNHTTTETSGISAPTTIRNAGSGKLVRHAVSNLWNWRFKSHSGIGHWFSTFGRPHSYWTRVVTSDRWCSKNGFVGALFCSPYTGKAIMYVLFTLCNPHLCNGKLVTLYKCKFHKYIFERGNNVILSALFYTLYFDFITLHDRYWWLEHVSVEFRFLIKGQQYLFPIWSWRKTYIYIYIPTPTLLMYVRLDYIGCYIRRLHPGMF